LNEYELSYCFMDNCTHNVTMEDYCMVQFSTYDGNYTYDMMTCENFTELGGDDNYTYAYPSTRPDTTGNSSWYCYSYYYDMYYDYLTEAAYESCYNSEDYSEYWCAYNITATHGDQIDFLDCGVFYDYTRWYDSYYRAMNDTNSSNSTNSTDW
jgi:hypothetical protein